MIENQLEFKADTAQRLMAIARDERLSNSAHARNLPLSIVAWALFVGLGIGVYQLARVL